MDTEDCVIETKYFECDCHDLDHLTRIECSIEKCEKVTFKEFWLEHSILKYPGKGDSVTYSYENY